MSRGKPAYGLEEVKRRVTGGALVITLQARPVVVISFKIR